MGVFRVTNKNFGSVDAEDGIMRRSLPQGEKKIMVQVQHNLSPSTESLNISPRSGGWAHLFRISFLFPPSASAHTHTHFFFIESNNFTPTYQDGKLERISTNFQYIITAADTSIQSIFPYLNHSLLQHIDDPTP